MYVSPGALISGEPIVLDLYGTYFRDHTIKGPSSQDAPAVTLTRVRDLDGNAVAGPEGALTAILTALSGLPGATLATVSSGPVLPTGVYSLMLRTVAGLEVSRNDALVILPRPTVTSLDQHFFCDSGIPHPSGTRPEVLAINGENLYRLPPFGIDADLHAAGYQGKLFRARSLKPDSISGCRTVPFAGGDACFLSFAFGLLCQHFDSVELCNRVEARLPGDIDLTSRMAISVVPSLLDSIAPRANLDLFADFFIERSFSLPLNMLFSAVEAPVEVPLGLGGLVVVGAGAGPTARIDGNPVPVSAAACQPSGVAGLDLCQQIAAVVPQGFQPGEHELSVETASHCAASTTIRFAPQPVIHTVAPPVICQYAQKFSLSGEGFIKPEVTIDRQYVPLPNGCVPLPGDTSCVGVWLAPGALSLGTHRVQVQTPSVPRVNSNTADIEVVTGPPFRGQPTPERVFASGTRKVFVPVSNVTGRIVSARLIQGSTVIPAEVADVPGGAELTVPASAGSGAYQIQISDESPCPGGDALSRFLFTTDDPVVRSVDFETPESALSARTVTATGDAGPALAWLQGQGSTGSAVGASRDDVGPDWYFEVAGIWMGDMDAGLLRFDLRSTGGGTAATAPGVLLTNYLFTLEHAISPPPDDGSWAHYELSLQGPEGWTYRDASGTRPATPADLRVGFVDARVLGSWRSGAGSAALDNLAVELAR